MQNGVLFLWSQAIVLSMTLIPSLLPWWLLCKRYVYTLIRVSRHNIITCILLLCSCIFVSNKAFWSWSWSLKIRRPLGRLIFNMGIAIPGKTVFLIETAPCIHERELIYTKFECGTLEKNYGLKYDCVHFLLNRGRCLAFGHMAFLFTRGIIIHHRHNFPFGSRSANFIWSNIIFCWFSCFFLSITYITHWFRITFRLNSHFITLFALLRYIDIISILSNHREQQHQHGGIVYCRIYTLLGPSELSCVGRWISPWLTQVTWASIRGIYSELIGKPNQRVLWPPFKIRLRNKVAFKEVFS